MRKVRMMNCMALIMPHSSCIDPPMSSEMMKLVAVIELTMTSPASVEAVRPLAIL